MASLDKIEGGALEAVLLGVVVVLALLAYMAYRGVSSLPQALQSIIKKIWNSIDGAFSWSVSALDSPVFGGQLGVPGADTVYTGSNVGAGDAASYEDED